MPRGDKSSYTGKQKRKAEHIEEGYEKSGSGRGKAENHAPSRKGGHKGGAASAGRTAAKRSASAKKG